MTVAEVAAALRVSRLTVYRAIGRGDLTAYRVGGAFGPLRVPSRAILDYCRLATELRPARLPHQEER
jgi:excisionase family DNA binding protein